MITHKNTEYIYLKKYNVQTESSKHLFTNLCNTWPLLTLMKYKTIIYMTIHKCYYNSSSAFLIILYKWNLGTANFLFPGFL